MESILRTVVVGRESSSIEDTMATTPQGMPNVLVEVISPLKSVAIRGARVYLQSLMGMLTIVVGLKPTALVSPDDFLGKLWLAMGLALAPAVISVIQNSAELLAKLDQKNPALRG